VQIRGIFVSDVLSSGYHSGPSSAGLTLLLVDYLSQIFSLPTLSDGLLDGRAMTRIFSRRDNSAVGSRGADVSLYTSRRCMHAVPRELIFSNLLT